MRPSLYPPCRLLPASLFWFCPVVVLTLFLLVFSRRRRPSRLLFFSVLILSFSFSWPFSLLSLRPPLCFCTFRACSVVSSLCHARCAPLRAPPVSSSSCLVFLLLCPFLSRVLHSFCRLLTFTLLLPDFAAVLSSCILYAELYSGLLSAAARFCAPFPCSLCLSPVAWWGSYMPLSSFSALLPAPSSSSSIPLSCGGADWLRLSPMSFLMSARGLFIPTPRFVDLPFYLPCFGVLCLLGSLRAVLPARFSGFFASSHHLLVWLALFLVRPRGLCWVLCCFFPRFCTFLSGLLFWWLYFSADFFALCSVSWLYLSPHFVSHLSDISVFAG